MSQPSAQRGEGDHTGENGPAIRLGLVALRVLTCASKEGSRNAGTVAAALDGGYVTFRLRV
jgi:hypothetical protein